MIAFLTDFGLRDPYVGIVKGVIHSIAPNTHLIDISHDISPGNIREASIMLKMSYKYFPRGTVFLAVVDPGVGSKRRGLACKIGHWFFVGPDNGLFSHVIREVGACECHEITNNSLLLKDVSSTFHARDVFGPVAAHLENGFPLDQVGPKADDFIRLDIKDAFFSGENITGEIVYFDRFGNAITNIDTKLMGRLGAKALQIKLKDHDLPLVACYEMGKDLLAFGIIGSHGYLEISSYLESAQMLLGLETGDQVVVGPISFS